jgi:UDP-N-acetylglucosamine 2-epimerase (non-hydrolysing)
VHPRTWSRFADFGITTHDARVRLLEPLGFFDFVRLEQEAYCLLSDSGTVQEEACIFGRPNVTIRDVTERPETVECGSNVLAGIEPDRILNAVRQVTEGTPQWKPPTEYLRENVAETVTRIVLGHRVADAAEQSWQDQSVSQRVNN